MSRHLYALLVGIDSYPPPVAPLKGCVNDVNALSAYLQDWSTRCGVQFQIKVLYNQDATRQAIIDAFLSHLGQAKTGDTALFYYAGHGSQEDTPEEFWHIEPDRLDETLVCWDSRLPEGWDLADKELSRLITEIAVHSPHISIILDCCHAGSGTRSDCSGIQHTVRRIPKDTRPRPSSSFIHTSQTRNAIDDPPSPKQHILLAACRDFEEANEYYKDGEFHGIFGFFLLESLRQSANSITYRDLMKRTKDRVQSYFSDQSPRWEATDIDIDQPFLGGETIKRSPYFTVSYHPEFGWIIDGGAIHGISAQNSQPLQLTLFPFECSPEQLRGQTNSLGTAKVRTVLPHISQVHIQGIKSLTPDLMLKAIADSAPATISVCFEGEPAGLDQIRQAIQNPKLNKRAFVEDQFSPEFYIEAQQNQYTILRVKDQRLVNLPILGYTPESATQVMQQLEHISRWCAIARLANPSSRFASDAVRLELYQEDYALSNAEIHLNYQQNAAGKWKQPAFQVKLTNTSEETLYCALLNLSDRYAIKAGFFEEAGGVWLRPGEEAWAMGRRWFYASVAQDLLQQGITQSRDILKLIVSTAGFDVTLLEQDQLSVSSVRSSHPFSVPEMDEDWATQQITVITTRPLMP